MVASAAVLQPSSLAEACLYILGGGVWGAGFVACVVGAAWARLVACPLQRGAGATPARARVVGVAGGRGPTDGAGEGAPVQRTLPLPAAVAAAAARVRGLPSQTAAVPACFGCCLRSSDGDE